ncbi:FAD-dependent oxidoreductase [Burkholderia sp. Ac-20344]|uniref:FAD-dependent oxidoreductase n=1 Tax=Burkholderia sp. Ac-20344 TaxID=2703890 RepID=UPI00197CAA05|nr:FAD-dependent oxidoreductase [Burkholderia sp. Ac-20344]MBN3836725.1 FAD-dependent oxidoreductase [Burkholderia sp. Ac-20344]
MNISSPTIAIVGSGPSGCYAANFLRKALPSAEISVIEALPVPYGLLRYGVAADHQGVKGIAQQFDRLFEREAVNFIGNVRVGFDISFEKIAENFDVVVLAMGLSEDAVLDVPVAQGAKVLGAGALLRKLNGFPKPYQCDDRAAQMLGPLGERVAIVGTGNVAIDVARLLSKTSDQFIGSDIDDDALAELTSVPIRSISLVGRSSASLAKFDISMLRELCALPSIRVSKLELGAHESCERVAILQAAQAAARARGHRSTLSGDLPTELEFLFHRRLNGIAQREGRAVVEMTNATDGTPCEIEADTVITAIGFNNGRLGANLGEVDVPNTVHVYRVGWFRRGSIGAIAENRKDSRFVVDVILEDLSQGRISLGKPGLKSIEQSLPAQVSKFDCWRRIDEYERLSAPEGRCRKKITDVQQMLSLIR